MITPEIIKTTDGSNTLYIKDMDEHYHSVHGALTESEHVFIMNGWKALLNKSVVTVFEVGFGTGLNCLLTALKALDEGRDVTYISIEKYPLGPDIFPNLDYGHFFGDRGKAMFQKIHHAGWNEMTLLFPGFRLLKIEADMLLWDGWSEIQADLIYFDAFGPDKQPEMWTPEIFAKVGGITVPGSILVTYSAKGEVRRRMASAGFLVERLPGPPGKREMLRGIRK